MSSINNVLDFGRLLGAKMKPIRERVLTFCFYYFLDFLIASKRRKCSMSVWSNHVCIIRRFAFNFGSPQHIFFK